MLHVHKHKHRNNDISRLNIFTKLFVTEAGGGNDKVSLYSPAEKSSSCKSASTECGEDNFSFE